MVDYSQELNAWAKELSAVHLPRWEELPALSLYMDQVLLYINDTLAFLNVAPGTSSGRSKNDDKLLTSAMINNYVKQHFVPKPEKKRYQREHIACLIAYVLLKPVLPLNDIQKGIYLLLELNEYNFQRAYDTFCMQLEAGLQYVADLTIGTPVEKLSYAEMSLFNLGTSMSALSLATKLVAQKVLALNGLEHEDTYAVDRIFAVPAKK